MSPTSAPSCAVRLPTALVDASTRWPIMLMACASVKWLVLALLAGCLSIAKLHHPPLLADIPALTYGRLVALQDAVFIYGFASQAAMAIALWLICRLGATPLVGRGVVVIAVSFWNIGVLVGAVGILAGDLSPFGRFQFPFGAMTILLLAYCVYGVCAFLTFAARRECSMYPSLWFVLAGLVFFPWVLGSAAMTLWSPNVRGIVSPIIAAWAGNAIVTLWLGSIALAVIYYLLPKITGKNLYSYGLAVFAFWLYVLFGQSTGMHATAAFPSWIVSLSQVCTIFLVLPAIANAMNWRATIGKSSREGDIAFKFAWWGAALYVIGTIVAAIAALRPVNLLLEFTLFQAGLSAFALLGFVTMSFFAAFAYILPRVTEVESAGSTGLHYKLTLIGALLVIVSLLLAGIAQGMTAANVSNDYVKVVRSGAMPAGLAIIGFALMVVGQISWLWNATCAFWGCCCPGRGGGPR